MLRSKDSREQKLQEDGEKGFQGTREQELHQGDGEKGFQGAGKQGC